MHSDTNSHLDHTGCDDPLPLVQYLALYVFRRKFPPLNNANRVPLGCYDMPRQKGELVYDANCTALSLSPRSSATDYLLHVPRLDSKRESSY